MSENECRGLKGHMTRLTQKGKLYLSEFTEAKSALLFQGCVNEFNI